MVSVGEKLKQNAVDDRKKVVKIFDAVRILRKTNCLKSAFYRAA